MAQKRKERPRIRVDWTTATADMCDVVVEPGIILEFERLPGDIIWKTGQRVYDHGDVSGNRVPHGDFCAARRLAVSAMTNDALRETSKRKAKENGVTPVDFANLRASLDNAASRTKPCVAAQVAPLSAKEKPRRMQVILRTLTECKGYLRGWVMSFQCSEDKSLAWENISFVKQDERTSPTGAPLQPLPEIPEREFLEAKRIALSAMRAAREMAARKALEDYRSPRFAFTRR